MNFETGSQQPTEASMQTIRDLGAVLRAYPNARVRLEGHTDNTGDYAENKRLSLQRAETIKSLLVQNSVDGSRIDTAGMGPDQPLASNDSDEGRRKNRRTELVVLQKS
jgi:outer membrane protein OmpA-like peptidoglycan-associated protein